MRDSRVTQELTKCETNQLATETQSNCDARKWAIARREKGKAIDLILAALGELLISGHVPI